MQITCTSQSQYNINHKGYIKDRQFLLHNLRKTQFRYFNLQNTENKTAIIQAQRLFIEFLNKNPIKTTLYNLFTKFSKSICLDFKKRQPYGKENNTIAINTQKVSKQASDLSFVKDGKRLSYSEMLQEIKKETIFDKKKAMTKQIAEKTCLLEDPIRQLIIERNKFAQQKGYKDYYQYLLAVKFNTSEKEINNAIEEFCLNNDTEKALRKRNEILKKQYNIENEELKYCSHTQLNEFTGINKYLSIPGRTFKIVKDSFKNMGFNLEHSIKKDKIIYDFEKGKNINNRNFCTALVPGKSAGINATLNNTISDISILLHETGHGLYSINTSSFVPLSKKDPKTILTEAIAIMFETLVHKENLLKDSVPQKILEQFKEYEEIDQVAKFTYLLARIDFERELYKNPNQSFEEIFKKSNLKYGITNSNNKEWFFHHLIHSPAYCFTYIVGMNLANKIYQKARQKLGTELSENQQTASYLKNRIFRYGGLMNEKLLKFLL